jgi:predicted NUDIX family phosphoesterase
MKRKQKVLVFPRSVFQNVFSLLRWDDAQDQIGKIEGSFAWHVRHDAEMSEDWVQAIPCAIIRDSDGKCCVLRRVKNERGDLSGKLSLIIGGHIDDETADVSFRDVMQAALMRELEEEVGIFPLVNPRPIGIVIDESSKNASRHVAFIHEMTADEITPMAPEEFTNRSTLTGKFMDEDELARRRHDFDPWSRILIEDYVCTEGVKPAVRQPSFF